MLMLCFFTQRVRTCRVGCHRVTIVHCDHFILFFLRRAFNQIDFVIWFELKDVIRLINPNQTPTPLMKVYVPFSGGVNQLKFTINTSTFHISKNSELCFFDTP
ncbi:hypothetical protein CISIN_1g041452mg [Citrus sinensis]|uniref:Uncharacterized protein n=1 Tax=Citrus sinensis TaxID=2711 RepID=A0A067DDG2_CITSI|nr:hypothetical protein CISIN_1g041452mg [Citrus sinensis]